MFLLCFLVRRVHAALLAELFQLEALFERLFVLVRVIVHFIAGFAGETDQVIL